METIDVQRDNGLVTVTFNRPEKKNAINVQGWTELGAALTEIAANPQDRALVLTGAAGNFSSGADLSDPSGKMTGPIVAEMRVVGDVILRLHRLPIPTLAKVDGVAVGVALGLALGCDLVIASDRARFIELFPRRGLALDGGNSWLLPRLIGLQKAKELAFFGDSVSASEALAMGLVNRVVEVDQLDAIVDEWARRLASGPTQALALSKKMLNSSFSSTMDEALEDESRAQHICYTTKDLAEGMKAFMQRRDPEFQGL